MQEIKMIEEALQDMCLCSGLGLYHGLLRNNELLLYQVQKLAATTCACQAIWLRRILEELNFKQSGATTVFCDNNSAIKLSRNSVLHGRSKHIDVKFYFLRELTNDRVINLQFCRSDESN
ncbi:UNVERIFIED_CONTAM: Retrovirus-related Pol polyprotein from transposon TNT 1-94 [Sesamum radiatum]|uniref:Retrovirus-related Pol polyprotein from transposon TNT 1-94 n=1 Tax=Sesamum radiatum TaxID=300843 RepID=A0AAW2LN02_SESRA